MRTGIAHKSYGGFAPINSGECLIWRHFGEFETLSFSRKFLKWLYQAIVCGSHPDLRIRGLKSPVTIWMMFAQSGSSDTWIEMTINPGIAAPARWSHPDLRVRGLK